MEKRDVIVWSSTGGSYPGTAHVESWSKRDAFWRGARKAGKIVGVCFLCLLPFAVMEPFLFMIWGSISLLTLLLLVGPFLHLRYSEERESFERVDAPCPSCKSEVGLKPYVSTRFEEAFTVLCGACGQTATAQASRSRTESNPASDRPPSR